MGTPKLPILVGNSICCSFKKSIFWASAFETAALFHLQTSLQGLDAGSKLDHLDQPIVGIFSLCKNVTVKA